jgi:asparagine synthase (glutamine-hydrolysing)
MCGITGFIGNGSIDDLKRMSSALSYRGPDAEGYWQDQQAGIYLAHRRLSIIDLSGGFQPMWTQDHALGVTYNGEIYNHQELRSELQSKGHIFQTSHSDTEVLLHGYRQWGIELPSRLNGMWAFCIYDKINELFFLSRDRFGQKPLFYFSNNNTFAFSSELKSLAKHPSLKPEISRLSLKKYFAYGYIPSPNTLYSNVYKLPGGFSLVVKTKSLDLRRIQYWEFMLDPFKKIPKHPEQAWGEEIRELLKRSVKRRMMSDVPLGIFLSGGIDSSSITALAVEAACKEVIKTFSIGFSEASFDESDYSDLIARKFQTTHYHDILSIEKARDLLPEIFDRLDEPMGDSSIIPTYLLCKNTRRNVTVALGGDGADELFAGYDPFRVLKAANFYNKWIPGFIHPAIKSFFSMLPVSHNNMSFDFKAKRALKGLAYPAKLWNPIWIGTLDPSELSALFEEKTEIEDVYSEAIAFWDHCEQESPVDKTLQFYIKLYLQDDILVKIDRASMLNSLEVRAPFLDIDFVDFVRRIPSDYKYRNGETKYILKKAFEPLLPNKVLYRPKKGFGVPVGKWFLKGHLDIKSSTTSAFINDKIKKHKTGKEDNRAVLWNLFVLRTLMENEPKTGGLWL